MMEWMEKEIELLLEKLTEAEKTINKYKGIELNLLKKISIKNQKLTEANKTISELRGLIQKVNYAFYDRNSMGIKVEEQISEKHPELWGEIFSLLQEVQLLTPPTETSVDDHQSTSNPVDNQISGDMSDKVVRSDLEPTTQDDSERGEG